MILIVDTNILISALIKDSTIRRLLFYPNFEFYTSEQVLIEVNRHIPLISKKASVPLEEVYMLFFFLLSYVTIVPFSKFVHKFDEAHKIMRTIDEKDTTFVALALATPNDGIWTEDKHFQKKENIKVWRTKDLVKYLK